MNLSTPHLSFVAILSLAAAGIACSKAPANLAETDPQPPAARSSTMPAPPAAYDLRFIDTMSKHHTDAKKMAEMAHTKLEHPGLKELAKTIPLDQQKEIDQMKGWRDQWYPGAPLAVDMALPGNSEMSMDMSHLETMKPGHAYDVMFVDMMVPHHESAVAMSRAALTTAEQQEIKTFAQQIIDKQTQEIGRMKEWKTSLEGGSAPHAH